MNEFKNEFKNILKKPLYWLFICVFILVYTSEVVPEIKLYGPEGRNMQFSTASETALMDMAYTSTKVSYDYGYISCNKYLLGMVCLGSENIKVTDEVKKDLGELLNELKKANMTYSNYKKEIKQIHEKLPSYKFLGISYKYDFLVSNKRLDTSKDYELFRREVTDIMESMSFSKFTSRFFADIVGMELALFTVFIIAFIYKRKKVNLMAYYAALTLNLFLTVCVLAIVTYFITLSIGNLYNWQVLLIDFLEPLFVWLLPTILYITAEIILLSIFIKNGYLAVFIQCLYSIIFVSFDIKLSSFVIRWNSHLYKGYVSDLSSSSSLIYTNRLVYIVLTICFLYAMNKINKKYYIDNKV